MDKKSVIIGVKGLVIALITAESTSGTTYGEIESVPGAIEVALTANVSSDQLGADNITTYEQLTRLDSVGAALNIAAIGNSMAAKLLGHTYDTSTGVLTTKATDSAPYVAIGFEATKADGTGRKVWLLRGKFQESNETFHTIEQGSVNWQTPNISGTFGPRLNDGEIRRQVDEDDSASSSIYGAYLGSVPGAAAAG